jgi:glutaconate CoA-transferase subunit A
MSYHRESKEKEGYLKWLEKWVLGVKNREEYLRLLGEEGTKSFVIKRHRKSLPVDYGY